MKKLIALLFIFFSLLSAKTIVVYNSGAACTNGDEYYTSIEGALTHTSDGDIISICPGTYNITSDITVKNKDITIQGLGNNIEDVVLQSSKPHTLKITAINDDKTIIKNMKIVNYSQNGIAIWSDGSSDDKIWLQDLIIESEGKGLYLQSGLACSNNITIISKDSAIYAIAKSDISINDANITSENGIAVYFGGEPVNIIITNSNIVSKNNYGLQIDKANSILIDSVKVEGKTRGIYLPYDAHNPVIKNSIIKSSGNTDYALVLDTNPSNPAKIENNCFYGRKELWVGRDGYIFKGNYYDGVIDINNDGSITPDDSDKIWAGNNNYMKDSDYRTSCNNVINTALVSYDCPCCEEDEVDVCSIFPSAIYSFGNLQLNSGVACNSIKIYSNNSNTLNSFKCSAKLDCSEPISCINEKYNTEKYNPNFLYSNGTYSIDNDCDYTKGVCNLTHSNYNSNTNNFINNTPKEINFEANETCIYDSTKKCMSIGSIKLQKNQTYIFSFKPGDYYFDSLDIELDPNNSDIEIILPEGGPVRIFINSELKIKGNINKNGDAHDLFIYVNGNIVVDKESTTKAYVYLKGDFNANQPIILYGAVTSEGNINGSNGTFIYTGEPYGVFPECNEDQELDTITGTFNVVEPIFDSNIDPIDENNLLNQIYTKIVNKPFRMKVLKLKDDGKTLEKYNGIVSVELIKAPTNDIECALNPAIASEYVTFDNSESVEFNITSPVILKNAQFRIKYVNYSFPEECISSIKSIRGNHHGYRYGSGRETHHVNDTTLECAKALYNYNLSDNIKDCMLECEIKTGHYFGEEVKNGFSFGNTYRHGHKHKKGIKCIMECVFNETKTICSRDNFAIRPDHFEITLNSIKPIKSGNDFNITIKAVDPFGNLVKDYNETIHIKEYSPSLEYNDINNSKGCITGDLNFSVGSNVKFINGEANIVLNYSDVGDLNLTIEEKKDKKEFASVDENDGINQNALLIKSYTKIIKFIPDHFGVIANYTAFKNRKFTYISNDLNMSSILNLNITALNKQNVITENYNKNCYANDININISHSNVDSSISNILYIYDENNHEINSSKKSVSTTSDINILYSKNNFTYNNGSANLKIYINFEKDYRIPIDEFNFSINTIEVKDKNNVKGSFNLDKDTTFKYGRIKVNNITAIDKKDVNTTFEYMYWDSDKGWVINKDHNNTIFGDIKLANSYKPSYINIDILPQNSKNILDGKEKLKISTTHGLPYSAKIHLSIPSWLWYHPLAKPYKDPSISNLDCLTHSCLKVMFQKSGSGWAGIGNNTSRYNENNKTINIKLGKELNATKNEVKKLNW